MMKRDGDVGAIEERAAELGIVIPGPPSPKGAYVPARRWGELVYTSGMGPVRDGVREYVGRVGAEVDPDDAYAAARLATINCLAAVREAVGSLDRVEAIVKVTGFVRSAPGFDQQPTVLNGASDLLGKLFDERGRHARAAIGVSELPFGIPVEVELIAAISSELDEGDR